MKQEITGLILAGGRSRRFGTDKAAYCVEGRPMAEWVHVAMAPLVSRVLVSIGEAPLGRHLPGEPVTDVYPGAGPLAGIHAGMIRCRTPRLLVVACDMPFITTDALAALCAVPPEEDRPAVACSADGRLHPLCATYPASLGPTVAAMLETGTHRVHDLLLTADFVAVPLHDAVLRNVNHHADL